jgi:hypothetical protein
LRKSYLKIRQNTNDAVLFSNLVPIDKQFVYQLLNVNTGFLNNRYIAEKRNILRHIAISHPFFNHADLGVTCTAGVFALTTRLPINKNRKQNRNVRYNLKCFCIPAMKINKEVDFMIIYLIFSLIHARPKGYR